MPDFPHMKETNFPHLDSVDVYKYRNEYDYARYDTQQMKLQLCSVPWDMGEAHIGARTISGIGNVVWFETEAKRDKWFEKIPNDKCVRFESKYKALHRDNEIIVPVPFETASLYNYLVVDYMPFPGQEPYNEYETGNGIMRWFWFVREVEFLAPNSTKLILLNDAWQTFIYRLNITGMMLERGHAPLFEVMADKYLENPMGNNEYLLSEDVNFGGEPAKVASTTTHVFNEETYACFVSTASLAGNWGSKSDGTWQTPAGYYYMLNGTPSYKVYAVNVEDLNPLLQALSTSQPQWKQTVKGIFFAPKELLTLTDSFTFDDITVYNVKTENETFEFLKLDKSMFGYASEYKDLAKLYTWPYSCIVITDENGNENIIKIEDTAGKLNISAALSLAFPAITLKAHLLWHGGASFSVSFSNITSRSLRIGGRWYETLHSWNVPVFGVVQSSADHYDYDTHFDRAQQVVSYTNTYNSAIDSADTAKANADDSADTMLANTTNNANTVTANAALQASCNTTCTNAGNTQASADTQSNQSLNTATTNNAISFTNTSTNNQIDYQYASGSASMASTAISAAGNVGMSLATGNIPGAIAGALTGIGQAATIGIQTQAGVNYDAAQAGANNAQNRANQIDSNIVAYDINQHAITAANTRLNATNSMTTGAAANNAATMITNATNENTTIKANATRDKTTAYANAGRTRDTAQQAISNGIKQAALGAPYEFGSFTNTEQATTKPIALFANVLTQAKNYIKQTGDEFLRYGYHYNGYWEFKGDWCLGKHFTYWKLRDFWVSGLNIPDMYVDKLRFFLFGGVTIWNKPEDIGHVTIYDNM